MTMAESRRSRVVQCGAPVLSEFLIAALALLIEKVMSNIGGIA
jgi:hypothetical protein